MTIDFDIDPATGDLYLDGAEVAVVTGLDAIAQEVQTRLRWWRGEWFLDTRQGTPYLESILRKGVTEATVRAALTAEIEQVPGVVRVESMDVAIDRVTRRCTVTRLEIQADEGTVELAGIQVGA